MLDDVKMNLNVGIFKNCTVEVTGGLSIWDYQETTNYGQTYHYKSPSPENATSITVKGSGGDISLTDKYSMWDRPKYSLVLYDTVYDNDIKSLKYAESGKQILTVTVDITNSDTRDTILCEVKSDNNADSHIEGKNKLVIQMMK